jgi:DNA-binding LacI/PurR family transcriptional regulator
VEVWHRIDSSESIRYHHAVPATVNQEPPRSRRATLADVARAAGVSVSTASLAYSRSGPVAEATRQRILDAAAALGYAGPDPTARSLRRGRTGVVAVILGDRVRYAFSDPMQVLLLDALSEALEGLGASLLLVPGATQGTARLDSVPLDAAVFADCGHLQDPLLGRLRSRRTPVVGIDGPRAPDVPFVGIDDEGSTAELVRHLLGSGHRELAVLALPLVLDGYRGPVRPDRLAAGYEVPRRRVEAARAALTGTAARAHCLEVAANTAEEGERVAAGLLSGGPGGRPTALMAQSDVLALGCLRAAAALGLRVPQDVSVTGFDGVELRLPDGAELTTVVQPIAEKGAAAGRHVAALLAGERPADVILPVRLRVGTTTGPARPAGSVR